MTEAGLYFIAQTNLTDVGHSELLCITILTEVAKPGTSQPRIQQLCS